MKTLIGIVIGASLFIGATAFAQTYGADGAPHGIVNVNGVHWFVPDHGPSKYYDYDNGVVCYVIAQGISCLKS